MSSSLLSQAGNGSCRWFISTLTHHCRGYATSSDTGGDFGDVTLVPPERRTAVDASFRKGTGGRSSFSGIVATVFGAGGFMGRYVVNRLGKRGSQIIIPYRGDPYDVRHLKLAGDLGQVAFFPFWLKDEATIRQAVKYSNVVINLIGSMIETGNFPYDEVHVNGCRNIARICREEGVSKLVHMSALNASPDPKPYLLRKGSGFLRSKYYGELAVREEFPEAIIIRPSTIYGYEDAFISVYMSTWRRLPFGKIDLYKAGDETFKAPVYCSDVASGIINAIFDPTAEGKTYEFVGPACYNLGELIDWMFDYCERGYRVRSGVLVYSRHNLTMITKIKSFINKYYMSLLWKARQLDTWNKEMMEFWEGHSDVLTGLPTLEDLGVSPLFAFERKAGEFLIHYDREAKRVNRDLLKVVRPPPPPHYPLLRKPGIRIGAVPGTRIQTRGLSSTDYGFS